MSDFTQAIYNVLNGDSTLTSQLGTYKSIPSIFTKRPVPKDATLALNGPYLLTSGEAVTDPGSIDTKNSSGVEIVRDIFCYVSLSSSPTLVESIAERVRVLFHRQAIAVVGYTVEVAEVTGPSEIDEEDALGRVVTVRLLMRKN